MFRKGFFTSTTWTVNGDGFAIGNNAEGSDFLSKMLAIAIPNGVPYLPSSNLLVTATTGMVLSVAAGYCFKDGYMAWETADTTITCTSSASEQTLYISARLDLANNGFTGGKIDKYTTFTSSMDIAVAKVVIPANAVTITQAMISDLRGDATYCGYITDQREYLETLTTWLQSEIARVTAGGMPNHASTHIPAADDPLPFDVKSSSVVINGGFDVAQKATSFSNPATNAILFDKWQLTYNGSGSTRTISRQAFTVGQTDVPNEPEFYARIAETVAGSGESAKYFRQAIEGVRTFAGESCSLSFYAKAASNATISVQFVQSFGSGGSTAVGTTASNVSVTTSWTKFTVITAIPSISGKTIGTGNYLDLRFNLPLNATYTIDIANVQLNRGATALPFVKQTYSEELANALRYMSIPSLSYIASGAVGVDANTIYFLIPTSVRMRSNPAMIGTANSDYLVRTKAGVGQTGFTFSPSVVNGGIYISAAKTSHGLTDAQLVLLTSSGFDANI